MLGLVPSLYRGSDKVCGARCLILHAVQTVLGIHLKDGGIDVVEPKSAAHALTTSYLLVIGSAEVDDRLC